jgi:hypothetical protein
VCVSARTRACTQASCMYRAQCAGRRRVGESRHFEFRLRLRDLDRASRWPATARLHFEMEVSVSRRINPIWIVLFLSSFLSLNPSPSSLLRLAPWIRECALYFTFPREIPSLVKAVLGLLQVSCEAACERESERELEELLHKCCFGEPTVTCMLLLQANQLHRVS